MRIRKRSLVLGVLVLGLALSIYGVQRIDAEPGFFDSDCAGCHSDDSPTCIGCHHHRGTLSASADKATYATGEAVTITLNGGSANGWMRGLLYDQDNVEVDRATGPTGTGDDGLGDFVRFPVTLQAPAPALPGDYTWRAGYFGNNNGSGHTQTTVPVTIHVIQSAAVPEDPFGPAVQALRVSPNPITTSGTLRFSVKAETGAVRVAVVDAAGRSIRLLMEGTLPPGEHQVAWDGANEAGHPVASGTYYAVLSAAGQSVVRALLVLR